MAKQHQFRNTVDWSQVHFKIDSSDRRVNAGPRPANWHGVRIPLTIDGLPPGSTLRGRGITRIKSLPNSFRTLLKDAPDHTYFMDIDLFERDRLRGGPVSLQTSLDVWVLNEKTLKHITVAGPATFKVPGAGLCKLVAQAKGATSTNIECWSGPAKLGDVHVESHNRQGPPSEWDIFPAGSDEQEEQLVWGFTPVESRQMAMPDPIELTFSQRFPVARFHAAISAKQIAFSEYGPH